MVMGFLATGISGQTGTISSDTVRFTGNAGQSRTGASSHVDSITLLPTCSPPGPASVHPIPAASCPPCTAGMPAPETAPAAPPAQMGHRSSVSTEAACRKGCACHGSSARRQGRCIRRCGCCKHCLCCPVIEPEDPRRWSGSPPRLTLQGSQRPPWADRKIFGAPLQHMHYKLGQGIRAQP